MKVSAPCSGPHSKSISGQCMATCGNPGMAPETISSTLGCVAAVSAAEPPSPPGPPFIHRMWTTGSAGAEAPGSPAVVSAVVIDDHLPAAVAGRLLGRHAASGWFPGQVAGRDVLPVVGDAGRSPPTLLSTRDTVNRAPGPGQT